jgi:membrane protein YdbS with pleckstrin-like domain
VDAAAPAALEDGADDGYRALDPRSIAVQRISGWIFTLVVAIASLVALAILLLAADDLPRWLRWLLPLAWLAGIAALGVLSHRWPVREYRHTSYRVDAVGIEIRKGVYWRVVIHVPRSRVQHTDVSQGPVQRRYGLGTLVIYTAGTDHARVDLAGLEHGVALRLREHLLPTGDADAV